MVRSSEKSDFDAASSQAVREAAPFNHLPQKFSKPFIEVRFTFYYNVAPSKW
jgi:outer membrane biosynthesis protein TonB